MENFSYTFKELINLMWSIYEALQENFVYMVDTKINDLFKQHLGFFLDIPIVGDIIDWLLNTAGIGDQTLMVFMIAGGLGLYIGITIVKWLIILKI